MHIFRLFSLSQVWPLLSKPFQRDKIEEAVEADGHRGKRLSELHGSYFN